MHSLFCVINWTDTGAPSAVVGRGLDDLRPLPGVESRLLLDEPGIALAGGGGDLDASIVRGRRFIIAVQGIVGGGLPAGLADSEQAVEAFAADPPDGIFNLLIWDAREKRLRVCSDPFGAKPLYYWSGNRTLVLSSDLKCFRHVPGYSPRVNQVALEQTLLSSVPLENDTLLADVNIITDSHNAFFDANGMSLRLLPARRIFITPCVPPERELMTQLDELLERSSRQWSSGLDRVMISLSGGVDSRMMLGYLQEQVGEVTAATWGSPDSDEVRCATQVARRMGVRHELCQLRIEPAQTPEAIEQFPWWSEMFSEGGGAWTMRPWMDYMASVNAGTVAHGYLADTMASTGAPHPRTGPDYRGVPPGMAERQADRTIPLKPGNRLLYAYTRGELRNRFKPGDPMGPVYIYQPPPAELNWRKVAPKRAAIPTHRRWIAHQLHLWSFVAPTIAPHYSWRTMDFFAQLPRRYLVARRLWRKTMRARFPQLSQIPESGTRRLPTPQCGMGLAAFQVIGRMKAHRWAWSASRQLRMLKWPIDYLGRIRDHRAQLADGIRRGEPFFGEMIDIPAIARDVENGDIRLTIHVLMRIYNISVFLSRFFGR